MPIFAVRLSSGISGNDVRPNWKKADVENPKRWPINCGICISQLVNKIETKFHGLDLAYQRDYNGNDHDASSNRTEAEV